jgi:hypothetical protein
VVYAKRPFAGPGQVLDYVGRYTHRVAISNNRLLDVAMSGLSPRPYACDPNLAAKPIQASNADQGYLMMEKIASGSRSNCAAQAWPNQARGAELPNGSSPRKSQAQTSFLRDHLGSLQIPRSHKVSHAFLTSGYVGSLPDIQLTINTHMPRAGQRLSPTHF